MKRILRIADFSAFADKYEHVSFDLFDTLIRRRFLGVHQVHDTVSAYALALLGLHSPKAVSDMTALRYRMGAALKSAPGRSIQEPKIEQVWDRILAQHHEVTDNAHRAELVEKVVRFEHEIELINLALIDGARDLLVKLRASGKRLIAISDMYFSEVQMKQILARLGLLDLFDHIYISAEENLTKQTGDLFLKVMRDLGIEPHQQIHVGDNLVSDVEMAASVGLEAVLVEQHQLLKLETPKVGKRKRIAQEVADLVKAHLFTVLFDVLNRRATQIYFMARDGIAIRDFLTTWQSELRDTFLPVPEHRELYLNRALTCWANVDFSGDWLVAATGWAFWLKEGKATRQEIADLLSVPPVMPELGDAVLETAKYQFILAKAYKDAGLEEAVKAQIIAKRATLERYLQGVGFYDHAAVAISDVGYSGTVGRALNTLLVQRGAEGSSLLPPKGKLHLIASGAHYFENKRFALPHCEFSDQAVLPLHAMPPTLTGSYAWLEYFFKHPTLLPITRLKEEDGQIVPELRKRNAPLAVQPASEVQAFAQDHPSDLILLWMAATDNYGCLAGPVIERFANPDRDTLRQMRGEVYELDPISGTTRLAFLEMPGARPDTIEVLAQRKDYWIAGSLAASNYLESDHHTAPDDLNNTVQPADGSASRKWWRRFFKKGGLQEAPRPPKNFDVNFYRSYYPDTADLGGDDELIAHFVRHGRKEQRFGSPAAMRAHLEVEFGTLPTDFDHEAYLHFNSDVAVSFGTPEKALEHYLRYGRHEGRKYRLPTDEFDRDLDKLVFDGRIVLQPSERAQLSVGAVSLVDVYLARFGLKSGAWLQKIDPVEFAALNGHWSGPIGNRAEALVALCEDGLQRMPSLSLKDPYNAEYVRKAYSDLSRLPDTELYRACLVRVRPTSEEGALAQIWNSAHYPDAFDWRAWQERNAKALGSAIRSEVLRHFLARRGTDRIEFITGSNSPELLEFLGNQAFHAHGSADDAITFFTEAMERGGSVGWFEHLIAEVCLARGERDEAIAHFRRGAGSATPNRWSSLHAAELLLQKGAFATALQVLEGSRTLWQDVEPWRVLWRRALGMQVVATVRKFSSDPPRSALLDELNDVMLRHARQLPAQSGAIDAAGPVLVITGRVMDISPRLPMPDSLTVKGLSVIDDRDFTSLLLHHSALVLHEVPCTADVLEVIAVARSLGRQVRCWLGDLASTDGSPIADLVSDTQGKEVGWLWPEHLWEMCLVARYCDEIVTTMAGLRPALNYVAPKVPIVLQIQAAARLRDTAYPVKAIMVLASKAIDQSGLAPAIHAINSVAAADPTAHFTLDHTIGQHKDLAVPANRLRIVDPCPDLQQLATAIGHCDLVVQIAAPHEVDPYSAVGEAWHRGCGGVMLVSSMVEGAASARHSGAKVKQLVPSDELTKDALESMMLNPPAPIADGHLAKACPSQKPTKMASRKARILFVNVWFPPQLIGGATKVLTDNVDYLLDHHDSEFDLSVFASDEFNTRCGELSLGQYRDVPVFRFATPQEENIYWRPRLAMADASFAALLDRVKPDLVHFHCLQRLGAGLLEVCQVRKIPHIVTLHDGWWLSDYPFMTDLDGSYALARRDIMALRRNPTIGGLASTNRAAKVRQILAGATRRLAVSEQFGQVYRDCGFQCDVLENGSSRLPVVQRPAADGVVSLLHLGGLERHKGAYLIEAALKQLGPSKLHLTLVDLARDAAFKSDTHWGETPVTIIGRQPVDALPELYARSHVLLAPSTCEESFGLVTREALQQGLWVVAGNRGAMGAPVEQGVNGFVVDVADASQLVAVLQQLSTDLGRFTQSPPRKEDLRTADDQSCDLVSLYQSMLGRS
jgi:HAD superfamily hydrolase (TIGR01549 family)